MLYIYSYIQSLIKQSLTENVDLPYFYAVIASLELVCCPWLAVWIDCCKLLSYFLPGFLLLMYKGGIGGTVLQDPSVPHKPKKRDSLLTREWRGSVAHYLGSGDTEAAVFMLSFFTS